REIGDGFLEAGQVAAAAAVYTGLAEAIVEHHDSHLDEEGDVGAVVNECVAGLRQCLEKTTGDWERREPLFRALWSACRADIETGGVGLGDEAADVLLGQATTGERAAMAGWVREAIQETESEWAEEALGDLLLDLEADSLDDESYLQSCRERGRTRD